MSSKRHRHVLSSSSSSSPPSSNLFVPNATGSSFNPNIFRSAQQSRDWLSIFHIISVCTDKPISFLYFLGHREIFADTGLDELLERQVEIYPPVVRMFYYSLVASGNDHEFETKVGGVKITINHVSLASSLDIPERANLRPLPPTIETMKISSQYSYEEFFCICDRSTSLKPDDKDLSPFYHDLHRMPLHHPKQENMNNFTVEELVAMYYLFTRQDFSLAKTIIYSMIRTQESNHHSLLYGMYITIILKAHGVDIINSPKGTKPTLLTKSKPQPFFSASRSSTSQPPVVGSSSPHPAPSVVLSPKVLRYLNRQFNALWVSTHEKIQASTRGLGTLMHHGFMD